MFWTVEEVPIDQDKAGYDLLSDGMKHALDTILSFFANADSLVMEAVTALTSPKGEYEKLTPAEATSYYSIQNAMESIHADMYNTLIDVYKTDEHEKLQLFNAYTEKNLAKEKYDFIKKQGDLSEDLLKSLLVMSCVEGIFFCSSFAYIYWLKQNRNVKLPGLVASNEFIARDESLHTLFGVTYLNKLLEAKTEPFKKSFYDTIKNTIKEAVLAEIAFVNRVFKYKIEGLNIEDMHTYVKVCGNTLLKMYGQNHLYNVSNPFPFMEAISTESKTNFFEARVTSYQKPPAGEGLKEADDF